MDELIAYRRKILFGYTAAGVATSLICLFAGTNDVLQEIPLPEALGLLAVMVLPICIGSVIAKDVTSTEDPWTPFAHRRALMDEAPITIAAVVFVLIIDTVLYLAELPRLMAFPPIVAGWLLNKWMQER